MRQMKERGETRGKTEMKGGIQDLKKKGLLS